MKSIISVDFPQNNIAILKLKNHFSKDDELIKIIEVKNCPTTLDASKFISNSVFRSVILSLANFALIRLKINEKLIENYAEKPKVNEFKVNSNFLISYESNVENYDEQKIIYWKNGQNGNFIKIKMLDGYSADLTEFVLDFLTEIIDLELVGMFSVQ